MEDCIAVHCSRVSLSGAGLTEVREPELGEGSEKNRTGYTFKFSQNQGGLIADLFDFVGFTFRFITSEVALLIG